MTAAAVVLIGIAFSFGGNVLSEPVEEDRRQIWINLLLGLGIAIALWGVFWVGDKLSSLLFPSFAREQVDSIYGMKSGEDPFVLSCLLLFLIGPAEELFWRGYVQRTLMALASDTKSRFLYALLAIGLYTAIHIASLNFMLIMSALVCGCVWGGLYWLFPRRLPALILSHALWDAAVFVWFPI